MKLIFIVDKKQDKGFSQGLNYPKEDIKKIDNQYKTSLKYIKLSQKEYQTSWNRINDEFSKYIEKETGYPWFHKTYYCIVSALISGGVGGIGHGYIARHWKENPYFMRRTTAHELIMQHFNEIYEKHYKKDNLTENQLWALGEIAAWSLTSLTSEVTKWWPWNTEYYTNHKYPKLVELQLKLKKYFLKRKSFDEYIRKGIELVKKYPKLR